MTSSKPIYLNCRCDPWTGTCECSAGWGGETCLRQCPLLTYGKGCRSTCRCENNGLCSPINGKSQMGIVAFLKVPFCLDSQMLSRLGRRDVSFEMPVTYEQHGLREQRIEFTDFRKQMALLDFA